MTRDLPLQPYNCVDWEGIEVPTFGCATNLAHLLGPRAGARLYHQGRYRNRDNTSSGQKPGCEPADMAQPPQAPAAAQPGDLYRLPCKSRTPQLPVTAGTPLGLPGAASSVNCQQASARENLAALSVSDSVGSKDVFFHSIMNKSFWGLLMWMRLREVPSSIRRRKWKVCLCKIPQRKGNKNCVATHFQAG